MTYKPVVIIGGGLAGLNCALTLHRKQVDFLLLEAGDQTGGRLRTDNVDGFLLDRGFHWFLPAYPEARRVLNYDRLKLRRFWPGVIIWTGQKFLKFSDPFSEISQKGETISSQMDAISDRLRMEKLRKALNNKTDEEIRGSGVDISTLKGLKAWGFSDNMIDRFFRPFLVTVFLENQLNTSYKKFEFIFKMFSQGMAAFPTYGIEAIPRQLSEQLPSGQIYLNSEVASIKGNNLLTLQDGSEIEAGQIVLATNLPQAYRLLGYSLNPRHHQVTCLYFRTASTPFQSPVMLLNGSGSGAINHVCFPNHVSSAYAPEGESLVSVTVPGIPNLSNNDLAVEVLRELKGWFGSESDRWELLKVYRINYALPAQTSMSGIPDSLNALRGQNIQLCGDYAEFACIDGALASGRQAGEALIEVLQPA